MQNIFDQMLKAKVVPNEVTMNVLFQALAKNEDVDSAKKWVSVVSETFPDAKRKLFSANNVKSKFANGILVSSYAAEVGDEVRPG